MRSRSSPRPWTGARSTPPCTRTTEAPRRGRVLAAPVPLRPPRAAAGRRRGAARRAGRPVDRHAVRPTARARPGRPRRPGAGPLLPAVDRHHRLPRGRRRLARPPLRCRGGPDPGGGLRGNQGAGGRRAPVAPAAHPRTRHRPLPGDQLPHLRHGCHLGRVPGGAGARRRVVGHPPRRHRPRRRRPGAVPVGQHARQPAGGLDDLAAAAAWGRERGVPVLSDECYAEFTWDGPARSILASGTEGVLAVHSLSKRSNFAGARAGFYAGDAELVGYLSEVRKHAGFMVPGPVQAAGALAWADDDHVVVQRARYLERLERLVEGLGSWGLDASVPAGAFYLWVAAPDGDAWGLARRLAEQAGMLVSPGEFYGPAGGGHVRIAAVQPLERIEVGLDRLAAGPSLG
ncbi:MAG: pyridoxal phosphate-dependent aminotransferase [Acidimicrobiales bacterium]